MRLQAADAVRTHDKPDLEAPEAAAQRNLPVTVVSHEPGIGVAVAQVVRHDGQVLCEVGAVHHPERGAVKVDEPPFVQVCVDAQDGGFGVGARVAQEGCHAREGADLRQEQRYARVRGVDVDPDFACVSRRGEAPHRGADGAKVVDGARVGRAHRGGEEEGLQALCPR